MSGKTARRQRNVKPPPPVGKQRARKASPKVLVAVGATIAAVVVGVVLAVSLSGGELAEHRERREAARRGPGAGHVHRDPAGVEHARPR